MIDPRRISYHLQAALPSGDTLALPTLGLQWEEQPGELAVRLQARLPVVATPFGPLPQVLALGTRLLLYADWGAGRQEVWRGTTFTWRYVDSGARSLELTAYDDLIYLQQSEDDRIYPAGLMADAVLADIAQAWGLLFVAPDGLPVPLPKLVFRGARISQMILKVLEEAYWRSGEVRLLRAVQGFVHLVRPGQNRPIYVLGPDAVEEMSDEQDIHDLVTEVRILGALPDDEGDAVIRAPIEARALGRTEFGRLQAVVRSADYDSPDVDSPLTAKGAAERLIQERGAPRRTQRLTAPDLPFLRRGDVVHVRAGTLGARWAISGIQHDADRKRMQIEIDSSGLPERWSWLEPGNEGQGYRDAGASAPLDAGRSRDAGASW